MTTLVWLVIALPLAGAAILLLAGRRSDGWGHLLGCLAALASFAAGVVLFVDMLGRHAEDRLVHQALFSWVPVGGLQVDFGLQLDALSMCFVLLITGVGSLIHIYSIGYMAEDPERRRFFRLPEPLSRGDAAAGARRQLPRPVRRVGRRRPGVVPADRVLVAQAVGGHRGQESVRGQPRRRHGPGDRADGDVRLHRLDLVRGCLLGRTPAR